jgi:hypothetical protein
MPMYEGFFDHKDENISKKFMLRVRARDDSEAKGEFNRECPDTHDLTAIALKNGGAARFVMGHPMNTIEHAKYARIQRLLTPTDANLERVESAQELSRGAGSVRSEAARSGKGPTLDELKQRHPAPTSAHLINSAGFILVVASALTGLYLFSLNGIAIKVFAMSVIPTIVVGLLLIAVAWSMKALNRIAIAAEYQAQLSEYQHKNRSETE